MGVYEGANKPKEYRYEIHAGFFDTDIDRSYGEYPYGSYVFSFVTNDEEQARRIYESIYDNGVFERNGITGTYLHERLCGSQPDGHAVDLDWFFDDNLSNTGEFFNVTIYELDN